MTLTYFKMSLQVSAQTCILVCD